MLRTQFSPSDLGHSIESTRGRVKSYRKLNQIRTRRMAKVWLHVALSILVMNASAVARIQEGRPDQLRECARRVA